MRIAAFILLLAFSIIGCATSSRLTSNNATSTEWKMGDFGVRFQAGPRGHEDRSYSYYKISYTAAGQQERELVMESAHSLGGFESVTNGDPKNWIRIIADSSGRALLIEEEIPNDCGPCSNYILVRLDSNGFLNGTYLRLPSKTTGDHGGINYEYPTVRSLEGNILRFRYSQGGTVSKDIDRIEKLDRPTPPG